LKRWNDFPLTYLNLSEVVLGKLQLPAAEEHGAEVVAGAGDKHELFLDIKASARGNTFCSQPCDHQAPTWELPDCRAALLDVTFHSTALIAGVVSAARTFGLTRKQ
jgi:hypothetical protein